MNQTRQKENKNSKNGFFERKDWGNLLIKGHSYGIV